MNDPLLWSVLWVAGCFCVATCEDNLCGPLLLAGTEGYIDSPSRVSPSDDDVTCRWEITVPDRFVAVSFERFHLSGSMPSCQIEKVVLTATNNSTTPSPVEDWTLCGPKLPRMYYSTSNTLTITYTGPKKTSDTHTRPTAGRFSLRFESIYWQPTPVPVCGVCGQLSSASDNSISSPGFPIQYGVNCQCQWLVNVEKGYRIKFRFSSFELEDAVNGACIDSVKIYDGRSTDAKLLGAFCSSHLPSGIVTSSRDALVTFYSDYWDQFAGFYVAFEAELDERDLSGLRSVAAILGGVSFAMFAFLLLCSVVYKKYFSRADTLELSQNNEIDPADDFVDAVQATAPPSYIRVMAEPDMYPRTPEMTPAGTPRGSPHPSPLMARLQRVSPLVISASGHHLGTPDRNSMIMMDDLPQSPPPAYPGLPEPPPFTEINNEIPALLTESDGDHNNPLIDDASSDHHDRDLRCSSDDAVWQRRSSRRSGRPLRKSRSSSSSVFACRGGGVRSERFQRNSVT